MKIERFLHFWSMHNTTIIEILIGLILFSLIFLAYRTFFANSAESGDTQGSLARIDTSDIQKTLQKILETQNVSSVLKAADGDADVSTETVVKASAEQEAALTKLTSEVNDRDQTIEKLKAQIQQLTKAQSAAPAANQPNKELEEKLKNVEARLAEYEIISEDIADLSFYKEENSRLQKELSAFKGETSAASMPAPSATPAAESKSEEPRPAEPPVAEAEGAASATETPLVAPQQVPDVEVKVEPPPSIPAAAPTTTASAGSGDDDLMREFATALEEQKNASPNPAAAAAGKTSKVVDNSNLMGEFENFVKKG